MKPSRRPIALSLLVFIPLLLGSLILAPPTGQPILAQPPATTNAATPAGTIAYVLPNDEQGDEIHLIQPDGSSDRRIWGTDQPDPE